MLQVQKDRRLKLIRSQIRRLQANLQKHEARSRGLSRLRLVTFLAGFGLGIAAYYLVAAWLGWSLLAATLVIFNIEAAFHRKIDESIKKHKIWLELKSTQAARMTLDWPALPLPPAHDPQPEHPFEVDLDMTGKCSLHQLVDTAISQDGSHLLKAWLLNPNPQLEVIEQRQKIVKELRPLARFRDKLYLAFKLVSKQQLEGKQLLYFLEKPHGSGSLDRLLLASAILAGVNLVLFALNQVGVLPAVWGYSLALYAAIYLLNQKYLDPLLDESVFISEELKKFRAVLRLLETYPYGDNEHLEKLCRPFWGPDDRPSKQLQRITLVGAAIGLRMNPVFRLVLNVALPWDFAFARVLNRLKAELAEKMSGWLHVLVELEALNSLANFAYLNPEAVFPQILPEGEQTGTMLHAEGIGHPLLADEQRKCNDFTFREIGEVALITGSNMSGKSTFLKTLGVNLCLAFAGAPVVARTLQTRIFRLFTCVQIKDSVTDGFSFFYAEVKRLKALLQQLQAQDSLPLFFLIDEIFKGTNNRERLIGSRSYIQTLAGHHGLGAISTHDLELTTLASTIPQIINYHFREEVVDSRMVFDYQIRPGPCPSTNALKIMQMEGLPVTLAE
ncbi:MAG: hypothetical protein ACE5IY_20865 [bacterium]